MRVLIIGGSSGIGLETAQELFRRGHEVIGISRSVTKSGCYKEQLVTDVRDSETLSCCIEAAGEIDALVYSAGAAMMSAAGETDINAAKELFDVNFFGMAESVALALRQLSAKGKIVLMSSMAGILPIPYNAFYNASKAAVNAYGATLSNELKGSGRNVTVVMPGGTATKLSYKRKVKRSSNQQYSADLESAAGVMFETEQKGNSPGLVAQAVCDALESDSPPLFLPTGIANKAAYYMDKLLPKRVTGALTMRKFCAKSDRPYDAD